MDFIYIQFFPLYLLVFIFGLVIGSFLNVVIYRVPNKISIAKGRSHCPKCNNKILFRNLIPVISYLILKGRCPDCGSKISIRYPLIELGTGLMAILIVVIKGIFLEALLIFAIGAVLLAIAVIDIDTMTIPNRLVAVIIPLALILIFTGDNIKIWDHVIGSLIVSVPMYLSLYLIKDGFGGGDIKLFAVLGLALGWQKILLTLFISSIIGAMIGVTMSKINKEEISGKHIPFGPYICLAAMISMLFGDWIISWYIGFF